MDLATHRETLDLFSQLGINTQNDADLARGYFLIRLTLSPKNDNMTRREYVESEMFVDFLSKLKVEFFTPKDQDGEDVFDKIESLCTIIKACGLDNLRSFFDEFSPWIVSDWDAYLETFDAKKRDSTKIGALIFLLKCQRTYIPDDLIFETDVNSLYEKTEIASFWTDSLGLKTEQFAPCWEAVFYYKLTEIPVKIAGNITNAVQQYRKWYVPMSKLLSDYCDVKRYKKSIEKVLNPWAYLNKGIKKIPIEMGLSIDEALFDAAAYNLKEEKVTDVIRAAYYPKSRNDSGFECSFLLEQFAAWVPKKAKVLIVNPSPDFTLRWKNDARFASCETYYAVPDDTVAALYNGEFSDNNVIPFSDIPTLNSIERVLIMSRDYPLEGLDLMLESLSVSCDSAKILAVLPNIYFDSADQSMDIKFKKFGCIIKNILIISSAATKSSPRKKVLLYINKTNEVETDSEILLYSSLCDKTGKKFNIRKEHWSITHSELFLSNRTLISLQKQAENKKKNSRESKNQRDPAEFYKFSKEIYINYIVMFGRKNSCAGKAYYCEKLRPGVKNRRQGKRLTEIIEKGLRAATENDVLAKIESVPFDIRIDPYIVSDICSYYSSDMESLSLKTLWFCCRNQLQKNKKYNEKIAKKFFCGECQELSDLYPALARGQDYEEKMELLFEWEPHGIQLKYWQQLNLILETATQLNFIRYNPVNEILRQFSAQVTEEQREVRNALVKKTFTLLEEKKMLEFICTPLEVSNGPEKARRYEAESIWLVGAIRLFTGMTTREICALQWRDFVKIPGKGSNYQFQVTKFVSADGKYIEKPDQDDWKKYRKVPIVPALAEMLKARRKYLTAVLNVTSEELRDQPIILEKESVKERRKEAGYSYCKPRVANDRCKKIIGAAEISEHLLTLPDDENQVVTDIHKYRGDVFQSNFKYRANHTSGLTRGEINYILGLEPPDTFSRHYCDYTNDCVQFEMGQKLQSWVAAQSVLITCNENAQYKTEIVKNHSTDVYGPYSGGAASVDMILEIDEQNTGGTLNIEVDCEFGFSGYVISYEGRSDNNDA